MRRELHCASGITPPGLTSSISVTLPKQCPTNTTGAPLQLILSGYTLMFGVLVVTGARLGNDLGHRRIFLLGLAAEEEGAQPVAKPVEA